MEPSSPQRHWHIYKVASDPHPWHVDLVEADGRPVQTPNPVRLDLGSDALSFVARHIEGHHRKALLRKALA